MEKKELVIIENNQLTVESVKAIKKALKKYEELESQIKNAKEIIYQFCAENDIKSVDLDGLKITRIDPTSSLTFDSAKFKKEQMELYNQYLKISERKGYVKVEVK